LWAQHILYDMVHTTYYEAFEIKTKKQKFSIQTFFHQINRDCPSTYNF
jgi:hypothetical protein